jgi:hypothetical protein
MAEEIVNRVKQNTKLQNLDLEVYYPDDLMELDIKQFLHMELILKEKDFREFIEAHDWEQYRNKPVAVFCSTDAIIAPWAYMLIASKLNEIAQDVIISAPDEAPEMLMLSRIKSENWAPYTDKFVMIKGCSSKPVSASVYAEITCLLQPHAKKIMYGEACSNVPIWNKSRNNE